MEEAAVIGALAMVQSLFGIGLLVFGTPTFLLLGHSFAETLAILLPASITISVLQAWHARGQDRAFIATFASWCLLPLAVALGLILALELDTRLGPFVALLLAAFAALRLFPALRGRSSQWVAGHARGCLALMGAVHGFSNMGGAILVIFAASRHQRKEDVRGLVSFCYACFAAIQLLVLAVFTPGVFSWIQVGYSLLAGVVFVLAGQRVFTWVSRPVFDRLLTLFAAVYAVLLACVSLGLFE